MNKLNIFLTSLAVIMLVVYLTVLNQDSPEKTNQNSEQTPQASAISTQSAGIAETDSSFSKKQPAFVTDTVEIARKISAKNATKVSRRNLKEYKSSTDKDEEIYTASTEILTADKDYDQFFTKVKNSIVKINNDNKSFFGAVTKQKNGIFVITDKNTATEGSTISLNTLTGDKLLFETVKCSGNLISFKLKSPLPAKLKPLNPAQPRSSIKAISLGAISFDYGTDPEMTIGRGVVKKNGQLEISSKLRRCRPGTPLFTAKGTLFGITTWESRGNVGTIIVDEASWNKMQYPFASRKGKVKRYTNNSSRY